MQTLADEASAEIARWGGAHGEPTVAVAPGRVNLIGEHTDYNDGWVMPMAIDRHVAVAAVHRNDGVLRVHSICVGETREMSVSALVPPTAPEWSDYVAGVFWALREAGWPLIGADVVVRGNVPIGAGLSSSAALEVAAAQALMALTPDASRRPMPDRDLARLTQRAENVYVGMQCGIMDQFTAVSARRHRALLLDCRTLEAQHVPIPEQAVIVVMDTGVRRGLTTSAYNDRRESCERVVRALQRVDYTIRALRDVDETLLIREHGRLHPVDAARALHVVREIARPLRLRAAFDANDLEMAGRLMNESHESLRTLYEVSCPELDTMCELARAESSCMGARMTGAGFGGCAIALVSADHAGDFLRSVSAAYERATSRSAQLFVTQAAAGVELAGA